MNRIYVESSGLGAWLLEQAQEHDVKRVLDGFEGHVASDLTLLEAARFIGRLKPDLAHHARQRLAWIRPSLRLYAVDLSLEQALSDAFPLEPVRTLDAIHLATAVRARMPQETMAFLALDTRVRQNAGKLGFQVVP